MSGAALTAAEVRTLRAAFRMPSVQTMMSRKSSITNAFVSALIPVIEPTPVQIRDALQLLGMTAGDVRCAYCGDKSSEWDHLRPLVVNRRPTGYISEIANLVPSCGKCNQSKGNKNWLAWMTSRATHAPDRRGVPDLPLRIQRLKAYEASQHVVPVPFEKIVGPQAYAEYWARLDQAIDHLAKCQEYANRLKVLVAKAHGASDAAARRTIDQMPALDSPAAETASP
jgi:hypothetical protein